MKKRVKIFTLSIIFFSTSTLEESLGDDIRLSHDAYNIWDEDFR